MIIVGDRVKLLFIEKAIDIPSETIFKLAVVQLECLSLHLHVLRNNFKLKVLQPSTHL
jgi:hypothetical protein